MSIDITIFIRARNEAQYITQCLEQIFSQEIDQSFEVILLDSQSTDNTVDLAKKFPIRIFSIPPHVFSYSGALNFGQEKAVGSLFVPLSAHSIPIRSDWLSQLIQPLQDNENIAASYSRQIPWPDASPIEKQRMSSIFPETSSVQNFSSFIDKIKHGADPYSALTFSNASACVRTDLLKKFPFLDLPFSEDKAFCFQCLKTNLSVAYASQSVVYHSHPPCREEFQSVAYKSTLSRYMINHWIGEELKESSHKIAAKPARELLLKEPLWKSILTIPYAIFKASPKLLLTSISPEESRKRLYREASFYLASIGTTFGKRKAYRERGHMQFENQLREKATDSIHEVVEEIA